MIRPNEWDAPSPGCTAPRAPDARRMPLSRVLLGRMENRPRAAAFPLPLMGVSG